MIEGFTSSIIPKHKALVKSYVAELGDRGLLENDEDEHEDQQKDRSLNVETNAALDTNVQPEGLPTSVAENATASTLFESEDRKSLLTGSPFDPNWVSPISSTAHFGVDGTNRAEREEEEVAKGIKQRYQRHGLEESEPLFNGRERISQATDRAIKHVEYGPTSKDPTFRKGTSKLSQNLIWRGLAIRLKYKKNE